MNTQTKVIFRVDRDNVVFALFPEIPHDVHGRYCTTYQHVGQHSGADYQWCIATSTPATPERYKDLLDELTRIGYNVKVIKRYQRK